MIEVLLVDDNDKVTGTEEKLKAHREGLLHKAFSVFIVDNEGKFLIQKRAMNKYHSGGVYSNSCCSHQYKGETILQSVSRCIRDELGMNIDINGDNTREVGTFRYFADLGEMKEHEMDHVILCRIKDDIPMSLNHDEVESIRWLKMDEIRDELAMGKEYSAWFNRAFEKVTEYLT